MLLFKNSKFDLFKLFMATPVSVTLIVFLLTLPLSDGLLFSESLFSDGFLVESLLSFDVSELDSELSFLGELPPPEPVMSLK